ncbi:MAG: hypothetical protein NWE95_05720 [Candidatus Bathyarchaeota archaeon]|nr:hypothetical protein [Candidatus Bathyarchaeota archaeon]
MANKTLIIVVAVVFMVIVAGSVAWVCNDPNFNPAPTPAPTHALTTQEQVRDKVISFIIDKHNETAESAVVNPPLATNLKWTGGRQETGRLGAETYIYTSDFWTVVIEYPVVPNPIYTVYVDFGRTSPQIAWQGTVENGNITENYFTYKP